MKSIHVFSIITLLLFLACNAAEEIFQTTDPPEVSPIQSDKGFNVNLGDTVTFSVTATNPEEGDLTYEWSATGGTFVGSTRETFALWKATGGGNYQINIDVSNNDKSTRKSTTITVISPTNPFVNIIEPKTGDFLVEGTTVNIEFEAMHVNGISEVYVEANDSTIYYNNRDQSIYTYGWNVFGPSGETELKVTAHANTGAIGAQSILVIIEGILPGKTDD